MNAVAQIDGALEPASGEQIAEHLHLLFSSMPMQAGADPNTALAGYLLALQGRPAWAIEEAVRKFLRGEVEGASRKFCPRPPEIGEVVAGIVDGMIADRATEMKRRMEAQRLREQMAERNEFDDAHRQKMKFLFSVLQAGLSLNQVDRVSEATSLGVKTKGGIEAMMALGQEWGIPIPESLWQAIGAGNA